MHMWRYPSEVWHDAIVGAFLDQDLEGEEYDAKFVMRSWHSDESRVSVAFFLVGNAISTRTTLGASWCSKSDQIGSRRKHSGRRCAGKLRAHTTTRPSQVRTEAWMRPNNAFAADKRFKQFC
jgi:hypothetical protein